MDKNQLENQNKPQPKPNTNYKWEPDDKIMITGIEFDYLQKVLQPYEILLKVKDSIFKRMVEDGIAKEAPDEPNLDKNE